MFNKLSLKIGLLFLVFMLLIETFLFFVLYYNLADDRIDEVMESLLARGNTHRDVLEDHFDESTLQHVGIMESASEYTVVITDETGEVTTASGAIEPEMAAIIAQGEHEGVPQQGEVVESNWQDVAFIATESPITIDGTHKGHVYMFASTNLVKNMIGQLAGQFILIGIITLGATVIIAFILSELIAQPLIKMKEATEQISTGKPKVTLNTERHDELGDLARAITTLANDLEQVKRARHDFLSSISHELRTPLTYIKGYADILHKQDLSPDNVDRFTSIIHEESEHMSRLIKDLFDLAKLDQNEFVIRRERIVLCQLVTTVAERMEPAFARKDIALEVDCNFDTEVAVDSDRFQQVLMNVLDNALKHTDSGGEVSLTVADQTNTVTIAIADNGEGIPEEDLPHVFERLYRVEKSRSRKSGGTGLGLAIAKEIMTAHQGSIDIESDRGNGTTVFIRLKKE
ncbi:sensor histidine kinase [Lentibacillus saliphilus]|uniref:sensor histidine kinase n=1 Tax=Lentibacillus saliphilus TaxID=2737028 RepID=UPI001C2F78BD|nr:HAMP domain-containing sensor histidine kinase [Lentibacillus saliphilus]